MGDVTQTPGMERRSIRAEERPAKFSTDDGPCARWTTIRSVLHRRHRGVEQLFLRTLTAFGDRLQPSEGGGVESSSGEVSPPKKNLRDFFSIDRHVVHIGATKRNRYSAIL